MTQDSSYFERHIARLLIVLYYCGRPVSSLLDGETRQIDSLLKLQQFDFWVREPGHLALALLSLSAPSLEAADEVQRKAISTISKARREALDRLLTDRQADTRRVVVPGASVLIQDFDANLSYLTSCALISDRPSFAKPRGDHQIVMETAGIVVVEKILAGCPLFSWYRAQSETVALFFPILEKIDLTVMPYLAPDLTPVLAAVMPLMPTIEHRYVEIFGELVHAVV